jgi:hypothetical protein
VTHWVIGPCIAIEPKTASAVFTTGPVSKPLCVK